MVLTFLELMNIVVVFFMVIRYADVGRISLDLIPFGIYCLLAVLALGNFLYLASASSYARLLAEFDNISEDEQKRGRFYSTNYIVATLALLFLPSILS